jgi:hypothetical protein
MVERLVDNDWKGCGREQSWSNLRKVSELSRVKRSNSNTYSVRIAGVTGRDSIQAPPEHKSEALPLESTCSEFLCVKQNHLRLEVASFSMSACASGII